MIWDGLDDLGAIEVYPAATLKAHGLDHKGYKKNETKHRDARRRIADALATRMTLEVDAALLHASDDRLDAVACVLAGVDYLRGHAKHPTPEQRQLGEREGWIWVRSPT